VPERAACGWSEVVLAVEVDDAFEFVEVGAEFSLGDLMRLVARDEIDLVEVALGVMEESERIDRAARSSDSNDESSRCHTEIMDARLPVGIAAREW